MANSASFSPREALVEVELALIGEAEATISVRDHGKGIPEEDWERVFERCHYVHEERRFGGRVVIRTCCRTA